MRAVYDAEARAWDRPAPRPRGRVRPQGAHVRALLADPRRGGMLRGVGPLYTSRALRAPRPPLRERHPPPRAPRDQLALVTTGSSTSSCSPHRSRCSCSRSPAAPDPGSGAASPTTTCSSPGRRVAALCDYLRASACPPSGRRSEGHAVKRAVDFAARASGLALAARCRPRRARDQAGRRRPGLLPPAAGRAPRRGVRPSQAADDDRGAETEGAGWAVDYADPRITRVGRILRRLRSTSCRSSGTFSTAK